jgi:ubiquinone/menaquinone biosynthesis C-methylase UbiE
MTDALAFDDDAARNLVRSYVTADVIEQRRIVRSALQLATGDDVLDVGSGPGLLTAEMALEVGPSGTVTGIDPSEQMIALARERDPTTTFVHGTATELPFRDASFDAVTSTQVYEYVDDVPGALAEARRVLRPGGRLLVLDTDWDSIVWHSRDETRMRRVLAAWDEHLVDPYLPRRLRGLLTGAGFVVRAIEIVPLLNAGFDEDTYSAGLIRFVSGFVPGRRGITAAEVTAWADDLRSLGSDYFCSVNRYLFVADKPSR